MNPSSDGIARDGRSGGAGAKYFECDSPEF